MFYKKIYEIFHKIFTKKSMVVMFFSFLMGFILSNYINKHYFIALNDTASLPDYFYIYKRDFTKDDLEQGVTIAFSFKHKNDNYYDYNHPFMKKIVCKEGDILNVDSSKRYFCNKSYFSIARSKDSKGKKIDNFIFNGKIPKDKYFTYTTAFKSYDSRYWGFVDFKDIKGVAVW